MTYATKGSFILYFSMFSHDAFFSVPRVEGQRNRSVVPWCCCDVRMATVWNPMEWNIYTHTRTRMQTNETIIDNLNSCVPKGGCPLLKPKQAKTHENRCTTKNNCVLSVAILYFAAFKNTLTACRSNTEFRQIKILGFYWPGHKFPNPKPTYLK